MSQRTYYIPKVINQNYVFLWNRDEAIFLIFPWIFWLILGGMIGLLVSLIVVIIAGNTMRYVGIGKPRGYIRHWAYFNMPKMFAKSWYRKSMENQVKTSVFFRAETLPPSHIRHIAG